MVAQLSASPDCYSGLCAVVTGSLCSGVLRPSTLMLFRVGPLRDALSSLLCRVPPPPLVFVERFRLVCRVVPCELVGRPASFGLAVSTAPCPANARRSPPSSRTASGRRRGWCPHVVTVNAPYCFWWCGTGWGIDLLLFQVPLSPAGGFYTLLHRALPFPLSVSSVAEFSSAVSGSGQGVGSLLAVAGGGVSRPWVQGSSG